MARTTALAVVAIVAGGIAAWTGGAEAAGFFGRGANILWSDGMWDPPYRSDFDPRTLGRLKRMGFEHVRLNLRPFDHLDAAGRLDDRYLGTMRGVIDAALDAGLKVVADVHEYHFCQKEAEGCEKKLAVTWRELAVRLADYDERVAFEILNEPGGPVKLDRWGRMVRDNLATIRRSNPTRRVIVSPGEGGTHDKLASLEVPANDPFVVLTVHYYDPFAFTHQGTPWSSQKGTSGVVWGSRAEHEQVWRDFDRVADLAAKAKREVYLGEFGVYDVADPQSRFCWLRTVVKAAEARGWSWAYWQLTFDFRLMREKPERWNDWVVAALQPKGDDDLCRPPRPGSE